MAKLISKNLTVGQHTIRVTCSGYDTYEAVINVSSSGSVSCVRVIGGACTTSARPGIYTSGNRVTVYMKTASSGTSPLVCATTADFTYSVSGKTISFRDTSRTDKKGGSGTCSIRDRYWTFGDGDEEFMANPRHVFPSYDRSYSVRLKVTDSAGNAKTRIRNIRTGSSSSGGGTSGSSTKAINFTVPDGATLTVLN